MRKVDQFYDQLAFNFRINLVISSSAGGIKWNHNTLSVVTGGRAPFFSRLVYGGNRSSAIGGECGGGKTPL